MEILLLRNRSEKASPSSGEHHCGGWPWNTASWRDLGDIQPLDGQIWVTRQHPTPAALLCLHLHRLLPGSALEVLFHISLDSTNVRLISQRKISLVSILKTNSGLTIVVYFPGHLCSSAH